MHAGAAGPSPSEVADQEREACPVVGIGASTGGLEAVTQFLRHLSVDTGLAFVFVQHLDPSHESHLAERLASSTKMPVRLVTDGLIVQPDHVYVIPPNVDMTISEGALRLLPRTEVRGLHLSVDGFFHSLAVDKKGGAIGVILSGSASDGVSGMRAIKAEGGITFAQSENSSRRTGMPHSAVAAGAVDFVLPPEGIARELAEIARHPYVRAGEPRREGLIDQGQDALKRIFEALRRTSGVDFSLYKPSTIQRRMKRRMALHRLQGLEDYLLYMEGRPQEIDLLHEDLLINVTGFFRDPEAFELLKTRVFPSLLKSCGETDPWRAWVAGCATGEEAYSLAICMIESLGDGARQAPVRVFATDVSAAALETARAATYPESHLAEVSPERLRRFFTKVAGGYQVSKSVRDLCTFARQDLTRDPPFSRLDLVTCRNVLIYLESALQQQVLPIFHYALKPTGFLWLGSTESIGACSDLFTAVDRKHRIYARNGLVPRRNLRFARPETLRKEAGTIDPGAMGPDAFREADRVVLARYAPASVLVGEDLNILQFRGQTSAYLEPTSGRASLNLLRMARPELALELRALVQRARKRGEPARSENVVLVSNGQSRTVHIEVIPLAVQPPEPRCFLVVFEEGQARRDRKEGGALRETRSALRRLVERLRRELEVARNYKQAIIEDQEVSNDELRSANEEVLAANEELQSANEELEASKEELRNTNLDLNEINSDLMNVLDSVRIPIVILGQDMRIRRLTPMAEQVLKLTPGDLGRRIVDVHLGITVDDLERMILEVNQSGSVRERTLQDGEGCWYSMRIHPYRTLEGRVDGSVLAFVGIDELERSRQRLRDTESYAQAIVETVREGLLILDKDLRVTRANRAFCDMFQVSTDETEGRSFLELGEGRWNIPEVLEKLRGTITGRNSFEDLEVTAEFPGVGSKSMVLSGRGFHRDGFLTQSMLLAIRDVSRRKRTERVVDVLSGRLLHLREEVQRQIARELHDSTGQNLSGLAINLALLGEYTEALPPEGRKAMARSLSLAEECARELQDLSALLHPPLLEEVGLVPAVQWIAQAFGRRTGIEVHVDAPPEQDGLPLDVKMAIFRIVQECLTNVQRHSGSPTAWVRIDRGPAGVEVSVRDAGRGIQGPRTSSDGVPAGVGMIGMRERVRQVGGTLDIATGEGGTTIQARIPLPPEVS